MTTAEDIVMYIFLLVGGALLLVLVGGVFIRGLLEFWGEYKPWQVAMFGVAIASYGGIALVGIALVLYSIFKRKPIWGDPCSK